MTKYARLKKDTEFNSVQNSTIVPEGTIVTVDKWILRTTSTKIKGLSFKWLGYRLELNELYTLVAFEKVDATIEFLND